MMIGGGNYGTAGQHHSGCSFLKFIGIFMAMLIISLPVAFADELQLTYDANGNLLSGDGYNRTYNSLNQLVEIRNSTGSLLEEFVYHPVEERILVKKVYNSSGSIKERIIYVDDNFVRVVNSSGSFDFTYVMHEGQKVAEELNDVKKFTITDHLGSTGAITDSVGTVVEQTTYSPYGEIISGGSSRFDYEGKEFDSVVGDYDFHFRKFLGNPPIFTQPDTLIQNVYDPQSLNRYMFERGNPYKNVDRDGHALSPIQDVTNFVISTAEAIGHNLKYGYKRIKAFFTGADQETKDTLRQEQSQGNKEIFGSFGNIPFDEEGEAAKTQGLVPGVDVRLDGSCGDEVSCRDNKKKYLGILVISHTPPKQPPKITYEGNTQKQTSQKTTSKTTTQKKVRTDKIIKLGGKYYQCSNC